MPKSWKPEVIADSTGKWYGNALRFATEAEALAQVYDLSMRWFAVQDTRATPCDDPATHIWGPEGLGYIKATEEVAS